MLRTFLRCNPQALSLTRPRVSCFSVAVKATTNEYPQVEVRPDVVDSAVSYMTSNQIILKGVSSQSQYKPMLDFDQMKLPPSIKSILKNEGFQAPTPIQALAWPIVLDKRDVISVARTGSGANQLTSYAVQHVFHATPELYTYNQFVLFFQHYHYLFCM